MFKLAIVVFAIIACAVAKPGLIRASLAYGTPTAALVAVPAPVVTATSSQVIKRNYNGVATSPIIAPVAAPIIAKTVAPLTAPLAYNAAVAAPLLSRYAAAYSTPLAYSTPIVAKYAHASYSHPFAYSAHLAYAAAPASVLF